MIDDLTGWQADSRRQHGPPLFGSLSSVRHELSLFVDELLPIAGWYHSFDTIQSTDRESAYHGRVGRAKGRHPHSPCCGNQHTRCREAASHAGSPFVLCLLHPLQP
jgi:hypothetical protein